MEKKIKINKRADEMSIYNRIKRDVIASCVLSVCVFFLKVFVLLS